jgi:hypothetical protein
MTTNEYLTEVLKLQKLTDDSQELKDLQSHRADVEKLLRDAFSDSPPTIRYGGSKAKGTLIKESYDLDLICYFPSNETTAGDSLKEIYDNVAEALRKDYYVTPKNSSLRLSSLDMTIANRDFHIDVVPGRYIDDTETDCFIHQNNADKERLKTNLDTHIAHVKDSEVIDAISLLKLWKTRKAIPLKQFVWELLVIDLLKKKKSASLEDQLKHVWQSIRDAEEPMNVEDPANPSGNDLSGVLSNAWSILSATADSTLRSIENVGWESVFGTIKRTESKEARVAALASAAGSASIRSSSWSC